MHPVGRICDPKEIGEFIAFLGSVRRPHLASALLSSRTDRRLLLSSVLILSVRTSTHAGLEPLHHRERAAN